MSQNLSVGGFLLSANCAIPLDMQVSFFVTIRGSSLMRPVHLTGVGRIVRVQPHISGGYAIAVECITPMVHMEQYLPAIAFC
jgi:hypothetical protein